MRLMLGSSKENPWLLVDINTPYDPFNFDFWVVNGGWFGRLINDQVYVEKETEPSHNGGRVFILCSDQKVLWNGDYNKVFETYAKWVRCEVIEYDSLPQNKLHYLYDDIPF